MRRLSAALLPHDVVTGTAYGTGLRQVLESGLGIAVGRVPGMAAYARRGIWVDGLPASQEIVEVVVPASTTLRSFVEA